MLGSGLYAPAVVTMSSAVTPCSNEHFHSLRNLFTAYRLRVERVTDGSGIPGSYWGDSEAGLIGDALFLRSDTPLHSALHEACHYICMDEVRRAALHTDAGGDVPEENAVCYLQGLLADALPGYDRNTLFADMDAWGYSFRLGSARSWFEQDAEDAVAWLRQYGLVNRRIMPTWAVRQQKSAKNAKPIKSAEILRY